MNKNYEVLNELDPKTQELHRAIFDRGYQQGYLDGKTILEKLKFVKEFCGGYLGCDDGDGCPLKTSDFRCGRWHAWSIDYENCGDIDKAYEIAKQYAKTIIEADTESEDKK